jgi:hypothetical protein
MKLGICYYLIPGTIVQLIKQDPLRGLSQMRIAGVPRPLWTYTRFLSERPVRDLYGVIKPQKALACFRPLPLMFCRCPPIVRPRELSRTEFRKRELSYLMYDPK